MKGIEILVTKNYDQFIVLDGNRALNERHINELVNSMSEEQCISPIQVNENMAVIDGQHRLNALKRLKKPVYYYVVKGASLKTVQRLNSYTKNWATEDYLESYINAGIDDYRLYGEFKKTYKFGNTVNILLLTGSGDRHVEEAKFKNGQFKIKNWDAAVEMAKKLEGVAEWVSFYKERSWCYALIKAIRTKGFNYKVFQHKCSYQQRKLVKCANTEQYLELIEEVYNYKAQTADKLSLRKL